MPPSPPLSTVPAARQNWNGSLYVVPTEPVAEDPAQTRTKSSRLIVPVVPAARAASYFAAHCASLAGCAEALAAAESVMRTRNSKRPISVLLCARNLSGRPTAGLVAGLPSRPLSLHHRPGSQPAREFASARVLRGAQSKPVRCVGISYGRV